MKIGYGAGNHAADWRAGDAEDITNESGPRLNGRRARGVGVLHRPGCVLAHGRGSLERGIDETRAVSTVVHGRNGGVVGCCVLCRVSSSRGRYRCDDVCAPAPKRTAKIVVWIAAIIGAILIAFPYYISYLM